ncbi:hypothetical protein D3C73_1246220 [compost metagenome]
MQRSHPVEQMRNLRCAPLRRPPHRCEIRIGMAQGNNDSFAYGITDDFFRMAQFGRNRHQLDGSLRSFPEGIKFFNRWITKIRRVLCAASGCIQKRTFQMDP